jgi:UDP-N-acetyl-D-mannosaminuronic acid dehydrogenase
MQLAAFYDNHFFLGHSAMLVNEGLPGFLMRQLRQKLGGSLAFKKIAILGMTFKANSDDTRDSLSFKLKKQLEQNLATVLCVDPYLEGMVPLEEALEEAEGLILAVPHDAFRNIVPKVPYVDCWNAWK